MPAARLTSLAGWWLVNSAAAGGGGVQLGRHCNLSGDEIFMEITFHGTVRQARVPAGPRRR